MASKTPRIEAQRCGRGRSRPARDAPRRGRGRRQRQPAARRNAPRARARPQHRGRLRGHRRPRPPQDLPGLLQPAASRPAAARDEHRGLLAPTLHRRGLRRRDAGRRRSSTHATRSRRALWDDFAQTIHYQQGDFGEAGRLRPPRRAARPDRRRRRLPRQPPLLPGHAAVGLRGHRGQPRARPGWPTREGAWSRIVIEKPFGHDLDSGHAAQRRGHASSFDESQVYRIDHYLGKETVQNLLVFRFANGIFEPVWNRRYVDHVQITVAEDLGVETRGAFYEEAGASRDILQNHMLQLLSLVAMEPPINFEADALRDEKVRVLRAIDTDWTPQPHPRRRGARPVRAPAGSPTARSRATARSRRSRPSPSGDLRGPAPRGRELALGRRALLPAHRQAPAPARHRDRHPVQPAAADAVQGQRHRSRAQHAGHAHPARRGHPAALRGQGARTSGSTCAR